MIQYYQGDNLPEIRVKHERDMSNFIQNCHATIYKEYRLPAKALAADTTIKASEELANDLNKGSLAPGIRAYLPHTREWILITAVNGINLTITRAQVDTEGNPSVAADIQPYDPLMLVLLDSVPLLTELDLLDTSQKTVLHTLSRQQTLIIPGHWFMQIRYQDGINGPSVRGFSYELPGGITILTDNNRFGAA